MHASSLTPVRDMVCLGDLNEASILHNLRARFRLDLIYTFIGPILVSVNPYKRLTIYTDSEIFRYHRAAAVESDLEPHIYGLEPDQGLFDAKANQPFEPVVETEPIPVEVTNEKTQAKTRKEVSGKFKAKSNNRSMKALN